MKLIIQEHNFLFKAVASALKGRILSRDAKHQKAIAIIRKDLEMFSMTGMVASQTFFLHALAEAYCAAGQVGERLEVILKSEQVERKIGEACHKFALQRIKGDLYRLGGDETASEEAYLNAIAVAQEEAAKLLELKAVKRLSRLRESQGKASQAKQMLQEVYAWFTEGVDTPMLNQARELLEELASQY